MAVRLVMAMIAGLIVATIAHIAHGRRKSDSAMLTTTLVLLTVLIAMVTLVIGNSVARAFGLVGALSIVRFRTVVDDTRDTAYVIFAVIVGMAIGAGVWVVPALGIPLVGALAIGMDRVKTGNAAVPASHRITLRIASGREFEELLERVFSRYLSTWSIKSTETARQGAAIDLVFTAQLKDPDAAWTLSRLVADLNHEEGILSVETQRFD